MDHPLRPIVAAWLQCLGNAAERKKSQFDTDAQECMAFFNGPYDWMYRRKYMEGSRGFGIAEDAENIPSPTFQMTSNKVAELVQLFGPVLYHRNPIRQVNARQVPLPPIEALGDPNDPSLQMQYMQWQQMTGLLRGRDRARSTILQAYLNYTPTELDLKTHARRAIDEAIIKGMGCLWTELYKPKIGNIRMVGSFYDTVDNLQIDPDVESWEDATWIARRCVHPTWQVERDYGLPTGSIKGNVESLNSQAQTIADPNGDYNRRRGLTNDLLCYWKIFSKMGAGGRLFQLSKMPELRQVLDQFGENVMLVIADGIPYPLNVPPQMIETAGAQMIQAITQQLQWPTPFWADDAWPVTPFMFHEVPRQPWPMSHLKPGMGELKFLNWCYSFLASKVRITCRDFIAISKSAAEELKDTILHGRDLTLLQIEKVHGDTIANVVQFLQHPPINGDVFKALELVKEEFERRTGLTELMYGQSSHQYRSAEEANVKGQQLQVRPDDMANKVEDAMTAVARAEALAARWHLQPQDVGPMLGPVGAQLWMGLVQSADVFEIVHQLDYRIEAGSTRKPNKDRDAANMNQAMQNLFTPFFQFAMNTGNPGPVNALLSDWAKSIDLQPERYLLPPPPPPPLPPPTPPAPPAAHPPQPAPAPVHVHVGKAA